MELNYDYSFIFDTKFKYKQINIPMKTIFLNIIEWNSLESY